MMRLNACLKTALLGGAVILMTACSMIGDMFPDKQKQYRYSSELPDLEIPPDLSSPNSDSKDSDATSPVKHSQTARGKYSADKNTGEADSEANSAKSNSTGQKGKKHKPVQHNDSSVTLAQNTENAALIEIQEPYDEAWNDVGRSLGRLKVEITDQNRSDGVYYVYYGGVPPKKPGEETSFWQDLGSVFSSNKDQAKEYRIKLEDRGNTTNVFILDQESQAISDGPGLELLKRLHKKLITLDQPDAPDPEKDGDKEDPKPDGKP
jgi:outer membrane protein assembly factor BamC